MLSIAKHSAAQLTFSLVGLLDGAWVCVALETLQTLLLASKKGLWVETLDAASSLGRFSAAVPTKDSLEMRSSNAAILLAVQLAGHLRWRKSRRLVCV